MKTDLSHLPRIKQEELTAVCEIILSKVPAEMIVLFGSYARGNWVEDYQEHHEYVSDYDILVITADRKSAKRSKTWRDLEAQLRDHREITRTNIIHHSIGFVNDRIEKHNYFFLDILKEGIVLHNSRNCELSNPKDLSPAERQAKAQEEFDHWFESANVFVEDFENNLGKASKGQVYLNKAAFELHQAVERYYAAVLLVFTDYKPRTHDIEDLGRQAANQHADFLTIFPRSTDEEKRLFELLKKSYIEARYSKNFSVEKTELDYLSERVHLLKELTENVCKEKIEALGNG
ncbi:MAG: HEPN domain-containing protein [Roseivirga sp.]